MRKLAKLHDLKQVTTVLEVLDLQQIMHGEDKDKVLMKLIMKEQEVPQKFKAVLYLEKAKRTLES